MFWVTYLIPLGRTRFQHFDHASELSRGKDFRARLSKTTILESKPDHQSRWCN